MSNPKSKKSKYIFMFGRIGVVLCGILWAAIWLSREQRWQKLIDIFGGMNLGVFAAVLCVFIIAMLLITLRWLVLLRTQGIRISYWAGGRLYFLGWFYNNFMPSSVGGDLIRAWYVTGHTDKKFEAVLSVFVDRVLGLVSTLMIAVFFYLVFLRPEAGRLDISLKADLIKSVSEHRGVFLGAILIFTAVLCGILVFDKGRRLLSRVLGRAVEYGRRILVRLKRAIVVYCRRPLVIFEAVGLTVFLQILTITAFWFLGASLGIDISVKYYYVFFTLAWVFGAVPVSIGGAVVVESLLAYMFIRFAGVEAESALALALCQRIVWMLASLPGAVIHIMGAHLPKEISVDYQEGIN